MSSGTSLVPSANPAGCRDARKRSSIRSKLVAVVLVGIGTATIIGTAASGWREAVRFAEAKRAEIDGTAHVLASAVADAVAAQDRMAVLKALRAIGKIPSFEYARVADGKGLTLGELGATVSLLESEETPILLRSTLETQVPVIKDGSRIGTVSVLVNTSELRQRLIDSSLTGLLAALLSAALGIAVAFRLQDRITRPLRELTATMSEIRQTSNFAGSVDHDANDETGVLVEAFNNMMGQIRQRDDRLAKHRETLEHTVEERTRDLRITKESAEDANAAKSDFLATMSHEIRTPMNGMLVMAELLASANLTDRHRRYADVVVKSGQSLLTIINDILDFSKIESGKMELERIDLDPAAVVDDVLNLFWDKASGKGLDLAGYVAPDVPLSVSGDPVRLNQVLSNLVNNALKFTEQGHVQVKVELVGDADSPLLRFAVSDTGIGIPQDKLATVFESFSQADQTTTRRFGGTGLGLAICKRLVGAMGGEIGVASKEGEGSEFSFTIANSVVPGQAGEAGPPQCNRLRNAIVSVRGQASKKAIAGYLSDRGIEAVPVGPEALGAADLDNAQLLLAEPKAIAELQVQNEQAESGCFRVCVSQLGDSLSDTLIGSGQAQDVLMRPVSRVAIHDLIDRLERGEPRGRTLLARKEAARLPTYRGARVLVADDSPINREVVTEALRQLEVTPDIVEDGAEAVRAAAAKTFDLIFMDCSMPEMDGFEATRRIRETEADTRTRVPIVALTAHIAGGRADEWREAGMDDYMTKPFRLGDLVERFEKYLPQSAEKSASLPAESDKMADEAPAAAVSEAETEADIPPVIDEDVLASLAGFQEGGGGELILRILSLFEEHAPPALLTLAEKASENSHTEIADAAHALKSMCRNIGAARLSRACDTLEAQARSGDVERLPAKIAAMQEMLVEVLAAIGTRKARLKAG